MNRQSARTALFLDAMGLGPAWTLRAAPELALSPATLPAPLSVAIEAPIQLAEPADGPVSAQSIAAMEWTSLTAAAASCTRCDLCHSRGSVVFGRGARDAALILVGSDPSGADDEAGAPLSGAPGQLLDNMLQAIGLARADVYVTNLVKCRVQDRTPQRAGAPAAPTPEQLAACRPYLERELILLRQGRTLLALGQSAARSLLGAAVPSAALRGAAHRWGALAVVATLHPEDMLRNKQTQEQAAEDRAKVWADLCVARSAHAASA